LSLSSELAQSVVFVLDHLRARFELLALFVF